MYTPETSCMKVTSVQVKITRIKQLCNHKVRDFAIVFRAQKVSRAFEKWAPGPLAQECSISIHVWSRTFTAFGCEKRGRHGFYM